jgi:hypothetical protein
MAVVRRRVLSLAARRLHFRKMKARGPFEMKDGIA